MSSNFFEDNKEAEVRKPKVKGVRENKKGRTVVRPRELYCSDFI